VVQKILSNDQTTSKKTFTNLDALGSADPGWDHCCMDSGTEESDTGVIATSSKDINCSDKIN
jgi:hypothetical protein